MEKSGNKILIVDDEHLVRWSVRRYLESEGFQAIEASSGQEALEILDSGDISVLITDLMMPEMDGVELINRALETKPDLDVLVITAIEGSEFVDSAQRAGAIGVFPKPIHFNNLLNTIQGLGKGNV